MTHTQRKTYSRKYVSLQKSIEQRYVKPVHNALKKYAVDLATSHDPSLLLLNTHIGPVIRRIYLTAGLANATRMRGDLMQTKRASFGTNDELVQAIIDYLSKYLLDKSIRSISETTRNWVMEQISKGVQDGLGAREIARNIADSTFLKWQALRIVRTETVRATNVGAIVAMQASPFEVQKEWISAHDNRVRHSHMLLDGQIREIDEDFLPGLGQPGDPRADASLTCNCRCTIAAIAKRNADGRLIRKPIPIPNRRIALAI